MHSLVVVPQPLQLGHDVEDELLLVGLAHDLHPDGHARGALGALLDEAVDEVPGVVGHGLEVPLEMEKK